MTIIENDQPIEDDVNLFNQLGVGEWSVSQNFNWRVNTIRTQNPWIERTGRAGAINDLASQNISDDDLIARSSELWSAWAGTTLADSMKRLNASEQRAVFSQLSFDQQRTLEAAGYKVPSNSINTRSGLAEFMGAITKPAQWALSDIGKPVGSAVFKALNFGYDQTVQRQWRTIAQGSTAGKIGFGVGAVGVGLPVGISLSAGLALSGVPGGIFVTAPVIGLSMLAAGTAGSFIGEAVTGNAERWIQAWSRAGDGEKLFTPESINEVNRKLGSSPELQALVVRISAELRNDIDLAQLVQEVSGQRDATVTSRQLDKLKKIALESTVEGTVEYQNTLRGLVEIVSQPIVQEAILTLQQGKYSIGRSFARGLHLDPNSSAYHFLSGGIDAASMVLLDPLNVAFAGVKAVNTIRRGVEFANGAVAAARFRALAEEPQFARVFEIMADGVRTGSTLKVRRYAKQWFPIYDDLLTYAREAGNQATFTGNDVVEWIVGANHLKSITSGIGIVPGINRLVLKPLTRRGYAFKTATGATLDFLRGISDLSLEKTLQKISENPEVLKALFESTPTENLDELLATGFVPDTWARTLAKEAGLGKAYSAGRTVGQFKLPGITHILRGVAGVADTLNLAVPRGGAIYLVENVQRNDDIVNFIDLFRTVGMPTYVRELWKKAVFEAPDFRTRVNALASLMDSIGTASGMRHTATGAEMMDNFLTHFKQEFAIGMPGKTTGHAPGVYVSAGTRPIADMAQMIAIPNLKELRQAIQKGFGLRFLIGLPEDSVLLANAMRIWKPAVLFRLGFAFRNSGEDILAMLARYGMGSYIQEFGARSLGKRAAFQEANLARESMNTAYRMGVGGIKLTTEQKYILNHYEYPFGLNKIANAVRRLGPSGSPILHIFDDWTKWVTHFFEEGAPGIRRLKTIEARMASWGDLEDIGLIRRMAPRYLTENTKFVSNSLVWGNKYSARRMLAGGVNPVLAQAGREWASTHIFSVMQRLGTAPGFGLDYQGKELTVMQRIMRGEDPTFVNIQGERAVRLQTDPANNFVEDFHVALYNQMTGLTDDPIIRQVLPELLNVYDDYMRAMLPPDQLLELITTWNRLTKEFGVGGVGRLDSDILHAFLRVNEQINDQTVKAERFQDSLRKLLAGNKPLEGDLLGGNAPDLRPLRMIFGEQLQKKYTGLSVPTPDEFLDELRILVFGGSSARRKIDQLRELQTLLDSINPVAKEWIMAHYMRDWATDGMHFSDLLTRPTNKGVVYRGFRNSTEPSLEIDFQRRVLGVENPSKPVFGAPTDNAVYELQPDGSLRIFLSDNNDITFSASYDQAYQQVVYPDGRIESFDPETDTAQFRIMAMPASSGTILTVDLDALLKQFGATRNDLVRWAHAQPDDLERAVGILGNAPFPYDVSDPAEITNWALYDTNRELLFRKLISDNAEDVGGMQSIILPPGTFTLASPFNLWTSKGISATGEEIIVTAGQGINVGNIGDFTKVFHSSFDEARQAMAHQMAIEFESGTWDDILNRNRRVVETSSAPVYVIDLQNLPPWALRYDIWSPYEDFSRVGGSDSPLRSESILEDFLRQSAWYTDVEMEKPLKRIVQSAVDEQVPLVLTDEIAANYIREVINEMLDVLKPYQAEKTIVSASPNLVAKGIDYIVPPVRKTFLPFGDKTGPELQGLVNAGDSKFTTAQKVISHPGLGGSGEFDVVGWPTDTYPWITDYLNDAPIAASQTEIINAALDNIGQILRPGYTQQWVAKQDLWTEFEGKPLKLPAGTKLDTTNLYSDPSLAEDTFVQIDDFRFTEPLEPTFTGQADVQWMAFAPMMYDDSERLVGRQAFATRDPGILLPDALNPESGTKLIFNESVEVPRFTDQDILNIPSGERPNAVIAKRRAVRVDGTVGQLWDKAVYTGFSKILGPMMDAMSRKPMAFHAFMVNFERNMKLASWRIAGTPQEKAVEEVISKLISRGLYDKADNATSKIITNAAKILGEHHSVELADLWTDGQAFAYLRGHIREVGQAKFTEELSALLDNPKLTLSPQDRAAIDYLQRNLGNIQTMDLDFGTVNDFVDNLISYLGDDYIRSGGQAARVKEFVSPELEEAVRSLTDKDLQAITDYRALRNKVVEDGSAIAAEAAIRDTLPYVDSHEIRSQFADWGRGYMPFWYAEENFIKRWAKILTLDSGITGLNALRKMHITYGGLRHMGFIRRDSQGKDWFVYPGSELFVESLARITGIQPANLSVFLQSPTDRMLPGIGSDFGRPSFGPYAILPVQFFTWMLPQIEPWGLTDQPLDDFKRNFLGDMGVNRNWLEAIVPKTMLQSIQALFVSTGQFGMDKNERLMSSTNSALAYMEASGVKSESNPNGMALSDTATAKEKDDFLRNAREWAKVGFIAQVLAGWVTPGPVNLDVGLESDNIFDFLTGGVAKTPDEILAADYLQLVRDLGVDEGTAAFMELYYKENNALNAQAMWNPLAFTVGSTESVSGAPLPSTEAAINFYIDNKEIFDLYKYAGPWLLPQDKTGDPRSQWAFDQTVIAGLRVYKGSSEDFLNELKFKEGAYVYFAKQREFDQAAEQAALEGNDDLKKRIEAEKKNFETNFKAAHPIFADQLQSEEARVRRQNVMDEMAVLVEDPQFPKADHFDAIRGLVRNYLEFKVRSGRVYPDGSKISSDEIAILRQQLDIYGQQIVAKFPQVNAFWTTIVKPLAGID